MGVPRRPGDPEGNSANNQFLLVCETWARELELSYVAGYRWWAENGYRVRSGEEALWALAPIVCKVEDETTGEQARRVVGFRNVPVFDRCQVDPGPETLAIEPPGIEPVTGGSHEPQPVGDTGWTCFAARGEATIEQVCWDGGTIVRWTFG